MGRRENKRPARKALWRRCRAWLPLLAALSLAAGCGEPRPAVAEAGCGPEGWESGDTLVLAADSLPAAGDYRLSFGLRTSATRPYPYRELVVGMRTETCDTAWTDTLVCTLADAQGEPAGSGLSHYQYEFSADTLRLTLRPALRVRIYHLMRLDPLTGVTDVGAALIPL